MTGKRKLVLLASAVVAFSGCVPDPAAEYTPEQLQQLTSLKELMRTMYHDLKPIWGLADETPIPAADFQTASALADRVQVIAGAVQRNFAAGRPEGFATFAQQLGVQAGEIGQAADASDTPGVQQGVDRLGKTCDSCHSAYR